MSALILCLATCGLIRAQQSELRFPGKSWEAVKPETAGYSSAKLSALRAWLATQKTTALHVSVRGHLVFEYGDVKRVSKVASVRKSILGMLFGNYVEQGKVNLNKTVRELGLDDVEQ